MTRADDPYLPERIRRALAERTPAGELDVQVAVRAGRLTITGNVADERRRAEIGALVEQLVPDLTVCNEIDVMDRHDRPITEEHLS